LVTLSSPGRSIARTVRPWLSRNAIMSAHVEGSPR
jgi:hypothetical protein